jgi:hypothetical protein
MAMSPYVLKYAIQRSGTASKVTAPIGAIETVYGSLPAVVVFVSVASVSVDVPAGGSSVPALLDVGSAVQPANSPPPSAAPYLRHALRVGPSSVVSSLISGGFVESVRGPPVVGFQFVLGTSRRRDLLLPAHRVDGAWSAAVPTTS